MKKIFISTLSLAFFAALLLMACNNKDNSTTKNVAPIVTADSNATKNAENTNNANAVATKDSLAPTNKEAGEENEKDEKK